MSSEPDLRMLEAIQDAVFHRLMGSPFLADVAILREQYSSTTDDQGNVQSEVEDIEARVFNALAALNSRGGKNGACLVVMMPDVQDAEANIPGLSCAVHVRVRALVNPLFNNGDTGTRKSEGQLALHVAILLQQFLPLSNAVSPLTHTRKTVTPINDELPPGCNGYETEHRMIWGVSSGHKAQPPTATVTGGLCALACTTAGAVIRYTINGGSACVGNPAAQVYDAPFAVEPGDLVKASAAAPDHFESDPLHLTAS